MLAKLPAAAKIKTTHPVNRMPPEKHSPGHQLRVWITNEDLEKLKRLSETTDAAQTDLLTKIVHAGIAALIEFDSGSIVLPIKFRVVERV